MKNVRIEKILNQLREGNIELGISQAAARWCRFYEESIEKGFDEIVIEESECVHNSNVKEMLEAAKELKIEYFVYASGFSGAFETLDCFVEHGARVGKFVVKEYTKCRFGSEETVRVPGIRINL